MDIFAHDVRRVSHKSIMICFKAWLTFGKHKAVSHLEYLEDLEHLWFSIKMENKMDKAGFSNTESVLIEGDDTVTPFLNTVTPCVYTFTPHVYKFILIIL